MSRGERLIYTYIPYAGPFEALPTGTAAPSHGIVVRDQRSRIYQSYAELLRERSDAEITVAHIIGLARVSRRAFYEQFHSKDDCYMRLLDLAEAMRHRRRERDELATAA